MQSRQLYASVTASIAGTVFFDMPRSGTIKGVAWAIMSAAPSAGDYVRAELSLSSTSQVSTNDAMGVLSVCDCIFDYDTSGGAQNAVNHFTPADCPVKAGERLYLNVVENGSGTWLVRCLVWYT